MNFNDIQKEDLKCCGNCKNKCFTPIRSDGRVDFEGIYEYFHGYCDKWEFDYRLLDDRKKL